MAIIRDANGLLAICGICKNSSRSIDPEPSLGTCLQCAIRDNLDPYLSSFMKRFFRRSSSADVTGSLGYGEVEKTMAIDVQLDRLCMSSINWDAVYCWVSAVSAVT